MHQISFIALSVGLSFGRRDRFQSPSGEIYKLQLKGIGGVWNKPQTDPCQLTDWLRWAQIKLTFQLFPKILRLFSPLTLWAHTGDVLLSLRQKFVISCHSLIEVSRPPNRIKAHHSENDSDQVTICPNDYVASQWTLRIRKNSGRHKGDQVINITISATQNAWVGPYVFP